MGVVEIEGVHKGYRRRGKPTHKALDGLDLSVSEGGVHGFLGPNGSGKTTTIRALLGLVSIDAGRLHVFGREIPEDLSGVIARIGALVETPLFFPSFSGRRNLALLAGVAGVRDARVEECLEIVGLRDRAGDRFAAYSLGMKQRLGIAAALLKAPALLILDEPSNGLDPAGIREIRELIRGLGEGGTTVLLSSHLLSEVQQVCDDVSIIARGHLVAAGRVADVLAAGSTGDVRVSAPDAERARQLILAAGFAVTAMDDAWRVQGVDEPSALTQMLAEQGCYVSELTPIAADLESVFLDLTRESAPERAETPPAVEAPERAETRPAVEAPERAETRPAVEAPE